MQLDRIKTLESSLDQATEMIAQHLLNLDELQTLVADQELQSRQLSDQVRARTHTPPPP